MDDIGFYHITRKEYDIRLLDNNLLYR